MTAENRHYSDKGGHLERSVHWKTLRRVEQAGSYDPTRFIAGMYNLGFVMTENGWRARRQMRRIARTGK